MNGEPGRRYFIGTATSTYPHHPALEDRPELALAVTEIRDLFCQELGYQAVSGFDLNLTMDGLRRRLSAFLTSPDRHVDDTLAFYYTGHGLLDGNEFVLPFNDSTVDVSRTAVGANELAKWLFRDTKVRRFLVLIDTCYSGEAGSALAREALARLSSLGAQAPTPEVAIVAATRPTGRAESLAFTRAFIEAARHKSTSGVEPEFLPIDTIVNWIREKPPIWQEAQLFATSGVGEFLPNPRYNEQLHGYDLRSRDEVQEKLRAQEMVGHVWPRAQGLDSPTDGLWLFTGREQILAHLSGWLRANSQANPALVITGDPGSGKSAVLSRLFVLANESKRGRIPGVHLLPESTMPPVGSVRRFIHARGKTAEEVLAGLAEATGVGATSTIELLAALRKRKAPPVTVIVDAVDEAVDPANLVHDVLANVIRNSNPCHLRLLIGTRRHLLRDLPCQAIDVDHLEFADPQSVIGYARRCLTDLIRRSPYVKAPATLTTDVAEAIGSAAGFSFLVALITARSLALRTQTVADPHDPKWRQSLPHEAAQAMQKDIDERLGPRSQMARDLLLPLAYTQGVGMPWENVWAQLACEVSGRGYGDDDIEWLIREAGYYIIESKEDGRSHYRLFHESLAEHLRGSDEKPVHAHIAQGLTALVHNGQWAQAHPYTLRHLAAHAAKAEIIDKYLLDPDYIIAADRSRLLAAALESKTLDGRRAAIAFQQATRASTGDPLVRMSYLQLAAQQYGADELVRRIREAGMPLPWQAEYASWTPAAPHRVLCRLGTPITGVAVVESQGSSWAIAATANEVRIWDVDSGRAAASPIRATIDVRPLLAGTRDASTVYAAVPSKGKLLVVYPNGPSPRRHQIKICSNRHICDLHWRGRHFVLFMKTMDAPSISVFELGTGRRRNSIALPRRAIMSDLRAFALRGKPLVAAVDPYGHIVVLDFASGGAICTINAKAPVTEVLCVKVGELEAIGVLVEARPDVPPDLNGTPDASQQPFHVLQLWDVATGERLENDIAFPFRVTAIASASMDANPVVVAGADDGVLRIYNVGTRKLITELYGHRSAITSLAIRQSPLAGSVVITASRDGTVRVWDLERSLFTLDLMPEKASDADSTPAAPPRISIAGGSTAFTQHGPWSRPEQESTVMALATLGAQQIVLTAGGKDGIVYAWDLKSGTEFDYWTAHDEGVWSVTSTVVASDTVVLTGGKGSVRAWRLRDGTYLA